jgi:hypothetical protein
MNVSWKAQYPGWLASSHVLVLSKAGTGASNAIEAPTLMQ